MKPKHRVVVPAATIRYFGVGENCSDALPGDLILVKTQDIYGKIIRFGERLRGHDQVYAQANHAMTAIGHNQVVEMVGGGGTVTNLETYAHLNYAVIHTTGVTPQAYTFAEAAAHWYIGVPYGFLSILSDAFYLLTGIPFALSIGQSVVCSAMAVATQRPLGLIPSKPDIAVLPSDLARWYNVQL